MTPRGFEERRQHPRVGIVRSMSLRIEGRGGALPADLLDLSQGGIYGVAVLRGVGEGAKLVVEIRVPDWIGTRRLRLPGILVRTKAPAAGGRQEFAVALQPLEAPLAKRLGRFAREPPENLG